MENHQSQRDRSGPQPLPGGAAVAGPPVPPVVGTIGGPAVEPAVGKTVGQTMKVLAACVALPFIVAAVDALAEGDPMERLRACSMLAAAERVDCLDKLSRDIGPPPAPPTAPPASAAAADVGPAADTWVV